MFKSGKDAARPATMADGSKPPRRKAAKMATAMRRIGLDENCLAAKYRRLLERLEHRGGTAEKLLFDAVKECAKLLGVCASPPAGGNRLLEPLPIRLVHDVPRPVRPGTGQTSGGGCTAADSGEATGEEFATDPTRKPFPN